MSLIAGLLLMEKSAISFGCMGTMGASSTVIQIIYSSKNAENCFCMSFGVSALQYIIETESADEKCTATCPKDHASS